MYVVADKEDFFERECVPGEFCLVVPRLYLGKDLLDCIATVEDVRPILNKVTGKEEIGVTLISFAKRPYEFYEESENLIFLPDIVVTEILQSEGDHSEIRKRIMDIIPEEVEVRFRQEDEKGGESVAEQTKLPIQQKEDFIKVVPESDNRWRFTVTGKEKTVSGVIYVSQQGHYMVNLDPESGRLKYNQFMWVRKHVGQKVDQLRVAQ